MIDISDGLAQDLGHILKASQVGAILNLNELPISPALKSLPESQQLQYALAGGDDYELCFTLPAHLLDAVQADAGRQQLAVTVVGQMLPRQAAQTQVQFRLHDQPFELQQTGFQHFD